MKTLLAVLAICLLAGSASAQIQATAVAGVGLEMSGEGSRLGYGAGIDAPVFTADGFQSAVRTVYQYTDPDEGGEIQAVQIWNINRKALVSVKNLGVVWLGIGTGLDNEMGEGEDAQRFALKVEASFMFEMGVGLGLGIDMVPVYGGPDKRFVYFGFTLVP